MTARRARVPPAAGATDAGAADTGTADAGAADGGAGDAGCYRRGCRARGRQPDAVAGSPQLIWRARDARPPVAAPRDDRPFARWSRRSTAGVPSDATTLGPRLASRA